MVGDLGDAGVERAGEGDGAVPLFRGEGVALLLEVAAERGDVGLGGAPRGSSSERTSNTCRASSTVGWATCAPRLGSTMTSRSWASA